MIEKEMPNPLQLDKPLNSESWCICDREASDPSFVPTNDSSSNICPVYGSPGKFSTSRNHSATYNTCRRKRSVLEAGV